MTLRSRLSLPRSGATIGAVATGLLLQATLVVSGVLVARMLGPEDRGQLALMMVFPLALAQLIGLGLPLSATYFISRAREIAGPLTRSLAPLAAAQAVLLLAVHAGLVVAVFADGEPSASRAAFLTLVVGPVVLCHYYALGILQGQARYRAFNLCRLVPFISYGVAVLAIFATGGADIEAIAASWSVTYLLGAVVAALVTARGLPSGPPAAAPPRRELVRFASKSFVGWVSPVDSFRIDQVVVGLFLSPVALGLYVTGLAFTNLPRFIAQSVGVVAYPTVAEKKTPAEARRSMWAFFSGTVAFSAVTVAVIWVLADWLVPLLFGAAFADAVGLTRILLVSALLLSARRILTDAARGAGYAGLGSVAEVVSWVVLVPSVVLLAASSGAAGVALALVLASAVSLAMLAAGVVIGDRRGTATISSAEGPATASPLPQSAADIDASPLGHQSST